MVNVSDVSYAEAITVTGIEPLRTRRQRLCQIVLPNDYQPWTQAAPPVSEAYYKEVRYGLRWAQ